MSKTKILRFIQYYEMAGWSEIEVPAEMSLEEAVTYAKEQFDDIPLPEDGDYVGASAEMNEESAELVAGAESDNVI